LFIVPLIIVAGLVSILGPNPSNWTSIPNPPQSGTTTMEKAQVVVAAVNFHNKEVKAISDDSLFNQSSTPPLSIQAIDEIPQLLVRE